jgi:dihydrolipoamide dehydrogenase
VTILEALPDFLAMADRQLAAEALKQFRKQGLDIRLGTKVASAKVQGEEVHVSLTGEAGEQQVVFDRLIVAIGRRPYTKGLLGEGTGVVLDERGFVAVDDHCATGAADVYAIGDCVRGPMLAHKAKDEGVMVADRIAGRYGHVNYEAIPSVIYTAPEIAWVGQGEAQARAAGSAVKTGQFPFIADGRARAMESTAGFVKIVADAGTDRILGVHIIGPMAGELIAECVLALEIRASCEDLQRTIHAHPTLSEAVHEAALAADGRAIDMPNRKSS